MNLKEFLSHFNKPKKQGADFMVKCPAHDDKRASLGISLGKDGKKILLNCFANCSTQAIVDAMGLEKKDLFGDQPKVKATISKTYDYCDEDDNLICQTVRMIPKDFRQRRPGKGDWIWNTKGIDKPLYRLRELIKSEGTVYIVEGEKDADRLAEYEFIATTNIGGAGKWLESYNESLRHRDVVIIPDNDEPGRDSAKRIAQSLLKIAKSVKVINLPDLKEKGDISDWLNNNGSFDLEEIVMNAPDYTEQAAAKFECISFADHPPVPTKWIVEGVIAEESCSLCSAEEKTGKSWVLFDLAICIANNLPFLEKYKTVKQGKVVLYSPESSINAKSQRLWGLSWGKELDPRQALKDVLFIKERMDLSKAEHIEKMRQTIKQIKPVLFIIDPLVTAYLGINENMTEEMQPILNDIRDLIGYNSGMGIFIAHHLNKDHESKSDYHGSRGSTAITAWADGMLSIRRQDIKDDQSPRRMSITHRDGGQGSLVGFDIVQGDVPMDQRISVDLFSYILVPHEAQEVAKKETKSTCRLDPDRITKIRNIVRNEEKYSCITRADCMERSGLAKATFKRYYDYMLENRYIRKRLDGRLEHIP